MRRCFTLRVYCNNLSKWFHSSLRFAILLYHILHTCNCIGGYLLQLGDEIESLFLLRSSFINCMTLHCRCISNKIVNKLYTPTDNSSIDRNCILDIDAKNVVSHSEYSKSSIKRGDNILKKKSIKGSRFWLLSICPGMSEILALS